MSNPDLSEFHRLSRPRKPPCQVGQARSQLTKAEQEQLDAALATSKNVITAGAVVDWLRKRRQVVSTNAVSNHRREICTCHDDAA